MIKLDNITLSYINEYNTLMNISCEINDHTFIQGSKDDGTHSLFRIIAQLENGYSGEILIDGINIHNLRSRDISLAYVPREPYLFNRDIIHNLSYPLAIRKFNKTEIKNIVNKVINNYIPDFPNKIKKMNNSQKKIIALLRAMIRKPKYILIEDLFEDLDNQYHELANQIINDISKDSMVIACENKSTPCYQQFVHYNLSFGSLTKIETVS